MHYQIITLENKSYSIISKCIPISITIFFVETPSIIKSPLSYLSKPPIIFNNVVFPLPLEPSIEVNSLSLKLISIPFNTS